MAKAKAKTKAAPVAQSREEVVELIGRIGELGRQVTRLEADYGDQAAELKSRHEALVEPVAAAMADAQARVQGWCEAHRDELTKAGKVKFARFPTGEVKWRAAPPSIKLRKVDEVIATLKRLGLSRFIRTKEEVNKEAMLEEADVAAVVAGVTVIRDVEDFIVEPHQPELAAVAA
jgi:phage host-nuclease inhibitor protein Gam